MVPVKRATHLMDEDYVLGVQVDGQWRAYPTKAMAYHHVINDQVADTHGHVTPIAITYCFACNAGLSFDTGFHGRSLKFGIYGVYNGTAALYERKSGGVMLPVLGSIVTGPLSGTKLKRLPTLDTTWGMWKRLHPGTLVMSLNTPYSSKYGSAKRPFPRLVNKLPDPNIAITVKRGDRRLAPFEPVQGVTVQGLAGKLLHRAYPLRELRAEGGVVNDTLGSHELTILMDLRSGTVDAFDRKVKGRLLTFATRPSHGEGTTFIDRETGSRWNIEGKAESGPLAGTTLHRLQNHLIQWFGWSGYFPQTSIYGGSDRPMPGNPFLRARSG